MTIRICKCGNRLNLKTTICPMCDRKIKLPKNHKYKGNSNINKNSKKGYKICPNCKKRFIPKKHNNGVLFCSNECKKQYYTIEKICLQCGNKFKVSSINKLNKYCSNECKTIAISGKNNINWVGGHTEYCDKFNNKCRDNNRNKFDHKCFLCGIHEDNLDRKLSVHHIDYNKNQGCNTIEWKLVPLCQSCHGITNYDRGYWENLLTTMLTVRNMILDYNGKIDYKSIGI